MARIDVPDEGWGLSHVLCFQNLLARDNITIRVYSTNLSQIGSGDELELLFDGSEYYDSSKFNHPDMPHADLNLLYHSDIRHFDLIRTLKGLIGAYSFCRPCNKKYSNLTKHTCPNQCKRCYNTEGTCQGDGTVFNKECEICLKEFLDENCYYRHLRIDSLKHGISVCKAFQNCPKCRRRICYNGGKHNCDVIIYKTCSGKRSSGHECFIQTLSIKSKGKTRKNGPLPTAFIFYDFETIQNTRYSGSGNTFLHCVNYGIVHKVCTVCMVEKFGVCACEFCRGGTRKIFNNGEETIHDFITYILEGEYINSVSEIIAIAHNSKGFDCQFILKAITYKPMRVVKPDLILSNTKIMILNVVKVKFIDSFNYFNMSLGKFLVLNGTQ